MNDISAPIIDSKTSTANANRSVDRLEAILHDASHEQLSDIIQKKAEWDEGFRAEVLMRLGAPDLKEVLNAVKERVRIAIRRNTSRGYIDWSACDAICVEMSDCLDAARSLYIEKYPEIAYEITLYLFISGVKLASTADSSSGSLTFVVNETMQLLECACRKLAVCEDIKLKTSCFEKLCKEALGKVLEGWQNWSYDLLEIAALLITQKNRQKLETVLVELMHRNEKRAYANSYFQVDEARVRLRVTEILEGKTAAREFINNHMDMDDMRLLAVQQDMESGDYGNAEHLCLEKLDRADNHPNVKENEWLHFLFDIYAATDQKQKQIDIANTLVCHGETQYYDKMKALYGGEWESVYPEIRAHYKSSLPRHLYMHILNSECEWLLLLNEVTQQPSAVFQYGKALAEYASEAVYGIYRAEIISAASNAAERREYKKVCASIRELNAAGGTGEALKLIDELVETYKRRPAMIEELASLRRKLIKQSAVGL